MAVRIKHKFFHLGKINFYFVIDINYRELNLSEIELIGTIDRSETIEEVYTFINGLLTLKKSYHSVDGFSREEISYIIDRQKKILTAKGLVFGAFYNNKLIGVASLENKLRGKNKNYCKMDILYVSLPYRNLKIGSHLLRQCKEEARNIGATRIYISATPTRNTVDFYFSNNATLVKKPDSELLQLEPEDIHLEIAL